MGFVPAQKLSGIVRTQPKTARIQLSVKFTMPSKSWLLKLPKNLGGTYYHTFNCVRESTTENKTQHFANQEKKTVLCGCIAAEVSFKWLFLQPDLVHGL